MRLFFSFSKTSFLRDGRSSSDVLPRRYLIAVPPATLAWPVSAPHRGLPGPPEDLHASHLLSGIVFRPSADFICPVTFSAGCSPCRLSCSYPPRHSRSFHSSPWPPPKCPKPRLLPLFNRWNADLVYVFRALFFVGNVSVYDGLKNFHSSFGPTRPPF